MAAPLNWIRLGLLVSIWLCPIWRDPTPVVPTLLWGGLCLGLLLLLGGKNNHHGSIANIKANWAVTVLLLLLMGMIAWRSTSSANALAAAVCLAAIGLCVQLGQQLSRQQLVGWIAYGWLLGGLLNSALALMQYFGLTSEPVGTAFGFLRQRNQMATLCSTALIALLYVVHTLRTQHPINASIGGRFTKVRCARYVLVLGAAALLCAALAATCSRTGVLQLTFVCVCTLALTLKTNIARRGQLALVACSFIVCYALAAFALPQLSQHPETVMARVVDAADTARIQINDSRRPLWDNTRALIEAHPLWGVGWRELAYSLHMTDFGAAPRFMSQADHSHNIMLQFAVELGLPFAVLWFSLLLCGVISLQPWRVRAPSAALGWGVLAVIAIHSLLEYPLWYAPFQIALGLALGLVMACQPDKPTSQAASVARTTQITAKMPINFPALCGTTLLIFCSYAAFDYHRVSQLFLSTDKRADVYQTNTMALAEGSWLFANQVSFAKLLITPVSEANAKEIWALGQQVIHFSPEPRVFKVLIAAGEHLAPNDAPIAAEISLLKQQLAFIER